MAVSDSSSRALFCSPVNGTAQEVCCARLLTVLVTGQRQMGGGDARQNALGVGDDVLALLQRLFLAGLQGRGVDGVDLGGQCLNAGAVCRIRLRSGHPAAA